MRISTLLLVAGSLLARTAAAQGSLDTGLLGRFPFDNSTQDATGNMGVNSATNVGYAADAGNRASAALRLTSTGEVWITPNGLLDFGTTGSFSFSVGFKTISSATQAFFTNHDTGNNVFQGWSLGFDNSQVGKVYFAMGQRASTGFGVGLATQSSYNDNTWHTAAVVVNRATNRIQLFVDGVAQPLLNTNPNSGFGTLSGTAFSINSQAIPTSNANPGTSTSQTGQQAVINRFGLNYNGSLDEARFYNRALTGAEVAALHSRLLATVAERRGDALVQLLPNPAPAHGALTLRVATPVAASGIRLLDALGRTVAATIAPASPAATEFTVAGLAPGLYVVRVATPAGPATRRLLVQ